MKFKRILLFITLLAILMGMVSATEVSDNTTNHYDNDFDNNIIKDTSSTSNTLEGNVTKETKEITKTEKNVKNAKKTYDVKDFKTLHDALINDKYSTVTLNIKSNIMLTDKTDLNEAIKTVVINGNGKTINGNNKYCLLYVYNEFTSTTIKNIKITNCNNFQGGALECNGNLTIINSTLNNNRATRNGGAIMHEHGDILIVNSTLNNNNGDEGGAIYHWSGLTIINSTLNNNNATYGGAIDNGYFGKTNIKNCIFNNNTAYNGGAIYNDPDTQLNIINNNITNNQATYGGAISNRGNINITKNIINNNYATEHGGAIYNEGHYCDNVIIKNNIITNNNASVGGVLYHYAWGNTTIINNTISNNHALYGGIISNYGNLTISNIKLNNNRDNNYGGILYNQGNLTAINVTLNNNIAELGGVIYNQGNLTLKQSTLNNNTAINGGAIAVDYGDLIIINSTLNNNNADDGGAINNFAGNITLINSTLNNNNAEGGGAIYNSGIFTLSNNIINNNTSKRGGGAIFNYGNLTVNNNTITNNTAINGGALINYNNMIIKHNILSNNNANIGGAIYNDANAIIENNLFKANHATTMSSPIVNEGIATIKDNINDTDSRNMNSIYTYAYREESKVRIIKNIFEFEKIYTKTTISPVKGIIGEKLTLKATIKDNKNNAVTQGYVIFKINGITIKNNKKLTESNDVLKINVTNGIATTTVTADLNMRYAQNITAVYSGSSIYNASRSNTAKAQINQRNASIIVTSNAKTIKQGQTLTITAKIYDTVNGKKSTNLTKYDNEFVYFKVNGITLKDAEGEMLKVKIVNGVATVNYTIPLGLSGITDGKTMTPKNHTILAGFYNKNYQENIRNTSTFQVERSNITITIANATVNTKTHKLSLTATIKDYLGNIVKGPNKCIIKVNGASLKNKTQPLYLYSTNGILNIKDLTIPQADNYKTIEIVTQDRLAYKSQRNTTTIIKLVN